MPDLIADDEEYKGCSSKSRHPVPTVASLHAKYGDFYFSARGKGGKGGKGEKGGKGHGGSVTDGHRGGAQQEGRAAFAPPSFGPPSNSFAPSHAQDGKTIPSFLLTPTVRHDLSSGEPSAKRQKSDAPPSPVYEAAPASTSEILPVLGETPKKKTKAQLMMEKMGWKAGEGLGKKAEGRLEAVITEEKLDKTVPLRPSRLTIPG